MSRPFEFLPLDLSGDLADPLSKAGDTVEWDLEGVGPAVVFKGGIAGSIMTLSSASDPTDLMWCWIFSTFSYSFACKVKWIV